jgi:hypothetical protein
MDSRFSIRYHDYHRIYSMEHIKQYDGPPYMWKVLVNGKWRKMSGFDEEHIHNILSPKKPKKIVRIKEKI